VGKAEGILGSSEGRPEAIRVDEVAMADGRENQALVAI
jgi:hypothetical protein